MSVFVRQSDEAEEYSVVCLSVVHLSSLTVGVSPLWRSGKALSYQLMSWHHKVIVHILSCDGCHVLLSR